MGNEEAPKGLRSIRQAPFAWQSVTAMQVLRENFSGRERTVAIAIYQAFTEISNERREQTFQAFRSELAQRAGVAVRTLDKYGKTFEEIGLLRKTLLRKSEKHSANVWELVEPDGGGGATADRGVAQLKAPGGGAAKSTLIQEDVLREEDLVETTSLSNGSAVNNQEKKKGENETFSSPPSSEENFTNGKLSTEEQDVEKVFHFWRDLAQPRNSNLTPSRARTIKKALAERSADELIDALKGLHVWRRKRGGGFELSRVFQSRPGGSPLGEQIDWFITHAKHFHLPASEKIPSADPALISRKLTELQRGYNAPPDSIAGRRAREAKEWLSQHGVEITHTKDGYPIRATDGAA